MADFIPTREADLVTWSTNFSSKISLSAVTYGLTPAMATAYATLNTSFIPAYNTAQAPATRSPMNITLKNTAKAALIASARSLARTVQGTASVTPAQKEDLGLTPRDIQPSPIPAPAAAPDIDIVSVTGRTVRLRLHAAGSPTHRGKPQGVAQAAVFSHVGATPPANQADWAFEGNCTRTVVEIQFPDTTPAGATVWIIAKWLNPKAQSGPFCEPQSTTLAGGAVSQAA